MNAGSKQAKGRSVTSSKPRPNPTSPAQASKIRSSSVERAFRIMEELAAHESVFGLSFSVLERELRPREKIPNSTLSNLLHTLNRLGYLKYNKEKKLYSLGLRLINLGEKANKRVQEDGHDSECQELLKLVVDQTKRGAHIAVLDSGYAVYLLRKDAPGFFGPRISPGKLQVPHFTAVGKALISRLDEGRLQEILDLHQTSKVGESKAIRTLEALKEDLADVQRRGYAIDDEEHALGVRCVAAPIYSGPARVVASIGVSCRKEEVSLKKLHEYGANILKPAAEQAARTPRVLSMLKRYSHQ